MMIARRLNRRENTWNSVVRSAPNALSFSWKKDAPRGGAERAGILPEPGVDCKPWDAQQFNPSVTRAAIESLADADSGTNRRVDAPAARATGARGFVVGLSGGVDSAVVARLAQLAAPGHVVAAILPAHSDPEDERDARARRDHFSLPTVRVDLRTPTTRRSPPCKPPLQALPGAMRDRHAGRSAPARLPLANIKPRLRMTTLYFLANSLDYLVAGTGNRSELSIGYFTKHGDGGVRPAAARAPREERGPRAGARAERADRRSSSARRARDCGSARPTRKKWASPTPISNAISTKARKASRPRWR